MQQRERQRILNRYRQLHIWTTARGRGPANTVSPVDELAHGLTRGTEGAQPQ